MRVIKYGLMLAFFLSTPRTVVATTGTNCTCLTRMIHDVITTHAWSSVTFVYTHGEGVSTPACLLSRGGLLLRLWSEGRLSGTTPYNIHHHNTLLNHNNFVLVYDNLTKDILDEASANGVLESSAWLVLLDETRIDTLLNQASTLNLFIDSTFLIATFSTCQAQVQSVYRVGPKSGLVLETSGEWRPASGYVVTSTLNKYDRRSNFQGYPMHGVGVKVFDFFSTFLPDDGITGYVGDILTILKRAHNFTLSYTILEGYAYGKLVSPTSTEWTGMVGELQRGLADLTVSELSITKERSDVIAYTQPVYIISRRMYVSTQKDFLKTMLAYATPMDTLVYVCVFASLVAMALALHLIERLRLWFLPSRDEPVGLSVAAWYMVSALLQQGCDTSPSSIAGRIIFWVGFMVPLIVYSSYSATLVSNLAVEKPAPLPFSNLLQLSRQKNWDAGVNNNDLFQVTASQTCVGSPAEECRVMRDVWSNVVMRNPGNIVNSYSQGLEKVLNGKYVFIGVDVATNYYIRQLATQEACRVKELPGKYLMGGVAIGLQHNSPFRRIFDHSLQRMREVGLLNRLALTWLKTERSCTPGNTVSASMLELSAMFILLIMGLAASLLVLAAELTISRSTTRNPTNKMT
ncbi:glutamate receptor ionotropic, delta-1-like isoform X2 [Cherax quadricarinatus]|uniref:glutamate receptor ionotropic, delta-1-like isoform X2 n=1 Tax=Cherax quadricarinatus TaxID=27406 RepID=UPI00387E5E35